MPVSGTRRMMTGGGWAIPSFDIKNPALVLYLPLWYPDSETTSSTIISKDINRHSCTATGTTWGSQGRTFVGSDDYITVPDAAILDPGTGSISIIIWWKSGTDARQGLLEHDDDVADGYYLEIQVTTGTVRLFIRADGVTDNIIGDTTGLVANIWHCSMGVRNETTGNLEIYLDGNLDKAPAAAVNTTTKNITPADNIQLGALANGYRFTGVLGEAIQYNGVMSLAEYQDYYVTTKWRFK